MNKLSQSLMAATAVVASVCAIAPNVAQANCVKNNNVDLVNNGGFESGSGTTIPGWTVKWKSNVDKYVYIDTTHPHNGAQDLALGTINAPNDIVQRIKGTLAGSVYTVCLWLYSSPNPTAGVTTFEVLWNNVPELSLTNSGPFGYQYLSFDVLAQGNSLDFLRFRERNKQGFYYLDDVAVQQCSGCGLGAEEKPQKYKE
jgi:hypothetical protein